LTSRLGLTFEVGCRGEGRLTGWPYRPISNSRRIAALQILRMRTPVHERPVAPEDAPAAANL